MRTFAMLMGAAALAAAVLASASAVAQATAQPAVGQTSAASHKKPMHPHQLTLYPHGKPARREPAYSYHHHRFDQPTAIHNTFAGHRYY